MEVVKIKSKEKNQSKISSLWKYVENRSEWHQPAVIKAHNSAKVYASFKGESYLSCHRYLIHARRALLAGKKMMP